MSVSATDPILIEHLSAQTSRSSDASASSPSLWPIYLAALFAVLQVRARWILPLAIVLTLVIHTAFYKLLKVPLPWGLLQPVLW